MSVRDDYRAAARAVTDQIARLPADRWDEPALGAWSLRELVAHTVSALTNVGVVCGERPDTIAVERTAEYYALRRRVDPAFLEAAVAAAAGWLAADVAALGDDPVGVVHGQLAAVLDLLADPTGPADDDVVATAAGGMRLGDWLPTRTFELAVHSLDIETATGIAADLPPEVLAAAATLAATTAVEVGDGRSVLRALTGRGGLSAGYTAL